MLLIGGRGNDGRSELDPCCAGERGGVVSLRMVLSAEDINEALGGEADDLASPAPGVVDRANGISGLAARLSRSLIRDCRHRRGRRPERRARFRSVVVSRDGRVRPGCPGASRLPIERRPISRTFRSAGSPAARCGRRRRANRATGSGRSRCGCGSRPGATTGRRRGAAPWRRRARRSGSAAG